MNAPDLSGMTPYDRSAWKDVQEWRAEKDGRSLVPVGPKRVLSRTGKALSRKIADAPGVSGALQGAVDGAFGSIDRVFIASVGKKAIVERFSRAGQDVSELADIRRLDLQVLDRVRPRLDLRYMLALAVEGAGAGALMTGAAALIKDGTVHGRGARAAPGAGLLVATTVTDAVAVVGACCRVAAETGAYYGYDAELPQERIYSMGVLGVALASTESAKAAAYQELNKVVQALARQRTWKELDSLVMTKVIKKVLGKYAEQVTKRKLGQAVPVIGIALGAGLNAKTLKDTAISANYVYRERFLADKYGLTTDGPAAAGEDGVDIVAIVQDEIAAEAEVVDAEIVSESGSPSAP